MTNRLRRAADVLLLAPLAELTLTATPALAAPTPAPAATTTDVQVVALPCWLNPVCEASKSVLDTVAEKFTDGAKEMLNDLAGAIDTATQVDLTESFFTQNYAVMLAVSAPIVLMLFLFDLVGAVLRRRNPIRSLIGVFQAVFGAALAVTFTELALGATDALSSYVLHQGMAGSAQRLSDVMAAGLVTGSSSGLLLVLAFFTMIAALAVWFILVLRKFAIYSVAVFAPIAFAGQAWAGTSRMAKRWAETLIALILSKFAISVLFAVAVSAIGTSKSITTVIGGLVMLIMALFSPWLCLKLVHFVEVHVAGEMLASMKSGATAPANAAVAGMTRAQQAQSLLGGARQKPMADVTGQAPAVAPQSPVPGGAASGGGAAETSEAAATADKQATPSSAGFGAGTSAGDATPAPSALADGAASGGGYGGYCCRSCCHWRCRSGCQGGRGSRTCSEGHPGGCRLGRRWLRDRGAARRRRWFRKWDGCSRRTAVERKRRFCRRRSRWGYRRAYRPRARRQRRSTSRAHRGDRGRRGNPLA